MSWLSKLLGKKEEVGAAPSDTGVASLNGMHAPFAGLNGIRFGRYSDNNKSYKKTQSWYTAEDRFKEKNYNEAFAALFDYLRDDAEDNVRFRPDGRKFSFEIVQGSKRVHGECDGDFITARVPLARMEKQSTAVMRRLLELNYTLYYSRCAMDEQNTLYMIFDTDVPSANPSKMYYGLRELATKADRQDDLLIADFTTNLVATDTEHIQQLPEHELDVKYKYFRQWITETLAKVESLNQDSFSGSIAYLLLTLLYRIDFLILPEARLLSDLERINALYWDKKDDIPLVERNQMMKDAIRKLLDISRDEFRAGVYRSKGAFAIASPSKSDQIRDNVVNSNKDSRWYIDNKYPELALVLTEYGMLYNCFISSMPRVLTDLTTVYMAVMHPDFFAELGMKQPLYNKERNQFDRDAIAAAIDVSLGRFRDKYTQMVWEHSRVSYHSLYDFGVTFSEQAVNMNLETKR